MKTVVVITEENYEELWITEEKNEPVCFSATIKLSCNYPATIQLSLGKNTSFAISPIPRFRKTHFPAVSELYKDTSMTHWIISWK